MNKIFRKLLMRNKLVVTDSTDIIECKMVEFVNGSDLYKSMKKGFVESAIKSNYIEILSRENRNFLIFMMKKNGLNNIYQRKDYIFTMESDNEKNLLLIKEAKNIELSIDEFNLYVQPLKIAYLADSTKDALENLNKYDVVIMIS